MSAANYVCAEMGKGRRLYNDVNGWILTPAPGHPTVETITDDTAMGMLDRGLIYLFDTRDGEYILSLAGRDLAEALNPPSLGKALLDYAIKAILAFIVLSLAIMAFARR